MRLTIEHRLTQRHDCRRKHHQHRQPGPLDLLLLPHKPPDILFLAPPDLAVREHDPQVKDIHHELDRVQAPLCGREADAGVPCRPAVHVVDGAVEGVGGPDRGVEFAAGHGVGAEEDVEGVPKDEREGEKEPDDEDAVGDVDVAWESGGAGSSGGFGYSSRRGIGVGCGRGGLRG